MIHAVRTYTNWDIRANDDKPYKEPYKKYFFICEGANTETWYLRKLIDIKKELGIHSMIDIKLLEKTDEDKNISYPKHLIQFARMLKEDSDINFNQDVDKMVIVFDFDIFQSSVKGFDKLLEEENEDIFAISNPAFELFLLLHIENSVEELILPNEKEIIENRKVGNNRYIYNLLRKQIQINCKKNSEIGNLAKDIDIAIRQEKKINEDIHDCMGKVTCNIAKIIDQIRKDKG